MHVFGDVWTAEVYQNALIFLFRLLRADLYLRRKIDVFYLRLDKALLEGYIQKEATFCRVSLARLGEFNLLNCVIGFRLDICDDRVSHV